MNKFDLIVVGAGTAGALAARTAAELGLKVGLLDSKTKSDVGDKVCGDAVGKYHFDRLGISPPQGEELAGDIRGVDIYSPDMQTVFRCESEGLYGFIINRREFGQRLLREALDAGAELFDKAQAVNLIMKDNFVKGVEVKSNNDKYDVFGGIIIDASGFLTVLRRQLPKDWGVEAEVDEEDVTACYREIRQLSSDVEDEDYCKIYMNPEAAPGGYYWIFPKGKDKVNVGLGVQMVKGFKNPKRQLYGYVINQPLFKDSKLLAGGGGVVPTRRSIGSMVGNGIMFVGDAACQPNPIHGGGIGPSMEAGKTASQVTSKAIEKGDVSSKGLWAYNVEFMKLYGAKAAGLDIFRIFLQKCGADDLNYGMKHRLVKEEDILKASIGEDLKLNITDAAQRVFRGLRKLPFLRALRTTAHNMKDIKSLYRNYPRQQDFDEWLGKVNVIVREMKSLTF